MRKLDYSGFRIVLYAEKERTMEKKITIGGKDLVMRATAATPMHYRNQFKKDMLVELSAMEGLELAEMDLGVFERMAYIMSGAFKDGTSLEDWLEQFEMTDILEAVSDIMDMWSANEETRMRPNSKNEMMAENTTQV